MGFAFHRAGRNILRISGLRFEPDAGIGQNGAFCKGLKSGAMKNSINHHQGFMELFSKDGVKYFSI